MNGISLIIWDQVKREREIERTLFATQIGTKETYNRIVHMRGRLLKRA